MEKSKWFFILLAVAIIFLVAFGAGLSRGKSLARQDCIDTVAENCDYICGVGADFTFPDKQTEDPASDFYFYQDAVALRLERRSN